MNRALFMAYQDGLDIIATQFLENVDHHAAGISEYGIHVLIPQTF
jgi:hypothetical protein